MVNTDPLKQIEYITKQANDTIKKHGRGVFSRYPLLFSLLPTFGVVSVLYGFESMINRFPFLAGRPWLVFIIGILILIFTGTLYKRLQRKTEIC